jgi:hypothetical protein
VCLRVPLQQYLVALNLFQAQGTCKRCLTGLQWQFVMTVVTFSVICVIFLALHCDLVFMEVMLIVIIMQPVAVCNRGITPWFLMVPWVHTAAPGV